MELSDINDLPSHIGISFEDEEDAQNYVDYVNENFNGEDSDEAYSKWLDATIDKHK